MFQHGKNGISCLMTMQAYLNLFRTAEQSEGNRTVGVDPTVITARKE